MLGPILVAAIRLFAPLAILRSPFWGMLLAIAADASDVIILDYFGWGLLGGEDYHRWDKLFDIYYLGFAFYASFNWSEIAAKRTSIALFLWRLAGVAVFEVTGARQVMLFAPSIFENFYLLVAGLKQFFPALRINTPKRLTILLLIAAIPKILQEYIMHYLEFQTWAFFKENLFWWLY